jgi:CheY-like chemotaxis protein/HPt (histidine-containing phosphotransfer) domain-containing protein
VNALFGPSSVGLSKNQEPSEIPADLSAGSRHQLLLAEDNALNQKIVLALARKKNWDMTVVCNGQAAVDAVGSRTFDLVLMDVQMPFVDGLEATRLIRQICHERNFNIPIIGMTAYAMPEDRTRCLAAGMDDYVAKPIKPERFYEVVERHLEKHSISKSRSTLSPKLDQAFNQNIQKNKPLMKELIKDFLDDYPRVLEELRVSVEQQHCREVEMVAHNLKSVIGFFNADAAYQLARQLETAAHAGEIEKGRGIFLKLEREMIQVRQSLMAM